MSIVEISNIYTWINKNLSEKKFATAFFLINRLVVELKDWNTACRYEELVTVYRNILNYRFTNAEENAQNSVFNRFLTDLYSLAESVREQLFIRQSSSFEYDCIRLFAANSRYFIPQDIQNIGTIYDILLNHYLSASVNEIINNKLTSKTEKISAEKRQSVLKFVFHHIWLFHKNNETDFEPINNILNDENIGLDAKCIVISALTLNMLRIFNSKKIEILFLAVESKNLEIRQRALVGIVLLLTKFGHYFKSDEKLKNRFLSFIDENDCLNEMESIIFQLIRTSETEKISQHIEKEIFPEFLKISPILKNKLENIDEDEEKERKPEWENLLDENFSHEKLQEFNEMQLSGSDVYASTFAKMKNYGFFEHIENWFLPFEKENYAVKSLFKKKKLFLTLIVNNPSLCNSDKYSLALSLLQMPEKQRNGMEISIKTQKEDIDEMLKEIKNTEFNNEQKNIANHYIQDLYRFYTRHPRHNDFENPLKEIVNLINKSIFYTVFSDNKKIENIASYYFLYKLYNQALRLYLKIFEHNTPNLDTARKIGYCYQKKLEFQDALRYYSIAENIEKNDVWTLRKMAFCYRKSNDYRLAADCYKRILEIKKDDLKLLFALAMCYIENENFDEALPLLHKINYLNPVYPKIKNVLLWSIFCCGKMEQAKDFAQKVLNDNPDVQDFIIIANIHLALNDKATALEFYKKALLSAKDFESFIALLNHDRDKLLQFGVKKSNIDLLLEMTLADRLPAAN
jgi:tetratricopeptide (TPR) repeat protein